MHVAIQDEFFPEMPAGAVHSQASKLDNAKRFLEVSQKHDGLVPFGALPQMLNMSRQRVHQIMSQDRLEVVLLFGEKFVTCPSIAAYIADERKAGRPCKKPGSVKCLLAAVAGVKASMQ